MTLELREVSVAYDKTPVVTDVSFTLPDGEVLAILGPSGCGKSTLLRAIAGLEPLTAGAICLDGADLRGIATHKRGFALMFQDGQLFGHLTVAGNVGYPLKLRHVPKAARPALIEELLARVGLTGYADRPVTTLSGGERQRVALARAFAVEPRLMLLDEPLSALDAGLRERLAGDLRELLSGTTAIMVTHDQEEAFAVADRLAVMRAGRLVQEGPTADVWGHPADPETAYFLGYATVLSGTDAAAVLPGHGSTSSRSLALRRSALVVDVDGSLDAQVVSLIAGPEQDRLLVRVTALPGHELHAVARPGSRLAPGDEVRLRLDAAKSALVGSNP